MASQYDATMKHLTEQRKEARARAFAVEKQIKKERNLHRTFLKKIKGLSAAQLQEAADRARLADNSGSAGAGGSAAASS